MGKFPAKWSNCGCFFGYSAGKHPLSHLAYFGNKTFNQLILMAYCRFILTIL